MPGLTMFLLLAGVLASGLLALTAFSGPSAGKQLTRRLEELRERHSRSTDIAAQAQLKRIFAQRQNRGDSVAKRFIPNPALLQLRLSQTGYSWTLAQYVLASAGLAVAVIAAADLQGRADALFDPVRPAGRRRPAASRRRQADQAPDQQVQRPLPRRDRADGARPALGPADLRDDRHRRRRDPQAGRHRVPHRLRQDADRPDDGRGAAGNGRAPRHAPNSSST